MRDSSNDEQTRLNGAKQEKALEVARNMLLEGMSIEEVANLTRLTEDDIEGLGIDPDRARRINELRQKKIWDDNSRINGARQEGIREEFEKAIKEGERQVAVDVAKELLLDGMPIEKIEKYTRLTNEEIKQLQ